MWYQSAAWLLKTLTTSLSLTVTLLLSPVTGNFDRDSLHRQAVQGTLVGIDLSVSKVPVRLLQFLYVEIVILSYILFTLILHWTDVKHDLYLEVLDWANHPMRATTVCLVVVLLIIPAIQILSFMIHHLIAHHVWKCKSKFSKAPEASAGVEESTERPNETLDERKPLVP